MTTAKRILFVAENVTLAHVTRLIVLASALDKNRYEIIFATGQQAVQLVESASFTCRTIPTLDSETFIKRLAKGERVYTTEELRRSVEADLALIKQEQPDLIVGDFRLSLGISAPLSHIPYISIVNAHWSPYCSAKTPLPELPMTKLLGVAVSGFLFKLLQPFVFKLHVLPFNQLRKSYGLPPWTSLQEAYTYADWTLYADIAELAPTKNIPNNHRYIGPVLWSPDLPLPEWLEKLHTDGHNPLIYLTLGSSGNIKIMENLLSFLAQMPVTVIVSTADRYSSQINKADNIHYASYLPGEKMAALSALVICNGGSATTYQALANGAPVLGFPTNLDQHYTMNAVVKAGAGLLVRSDQATEAKIKAALDALLFNPSYRNQAVRIKELFAHNNAALNFQQFLESID